MPEPPNLDPLDPERVTVIFNSIGHHVDCGPGAAQPGTEIWALNLDDTAPAVSAVVAPDGSCAFDLLASLPDNEVRLQVRDGSRRSIPVDIRLPDPVPIVHALDCVILEPPFEAALGTVAVGGESVATFTLRNGCASPVTLSAVRLRGAAPPLTLEATAPADLPPGGTTPVGVRFTPTTTALVEEAILLDFTAPSSDRRAVVVWGSGR
jgi:hypothetical protein